MTRMIWALCMVSCWQLAYSQEADRDMLKGNRLYRAGDFEKAAVAFDRALARAPRNTTARYNLGNTHYRASRPDEAIASYEQTLADAADRRLKADAWYNTGVVLSSQKRLAESIEAYKQALRLNPTDSFARENLVRALRELQKQQQQEQENQKKKKQQEKQQQPKMNKQQVQQLLQALQEQERQLQQKMQKMKVPSPSQPEKDW